ncbi:hypothetical protein ACOJVU_16445 [Mycobacterium sp. THU-M104]|uniref:hypothetical protein n=1 Tax=Mycobacterium sp. THU-M104 TaxID=3410515 RepID=UPI003B9A06D0
MSGFGQWFNYQASLKILVFSMLAGAALPGLFALGLRLQAMGAGDITTSGATSERNRALTGLAWAIYAVVVAVILLALAYVSRDFIAHHIGHPFLGAKTT